MTSMSKALLRRAIRACHQGTQARNTESEALCRHIIDSAAYRDAKVIGGYMPLTHEADVTPVLRHALAHGKTLALPLCDAAPHMSFRRINHLSELIPGAYGILEPRMDAAVVLPGELDLLLVPLEGIDQEGFRLGKGCGYYDAFLARTEAYTLGCALTWQWVQHVPQDDWDQPLNACADAQGIHAFKTISMI